MTPEGMAALEAFCFPHSSTWSAAQFRNYPDQPGAILIAHAQGFISGRVTADEAEIITVAVMPEARKLGVATQMLTSFLKQAADMQAQSVFLEVVDSNTAALKLYKGFGFEQVGLRKQYYRWPDGTANDALVMKKTLHPEMPR